MDEKLEKQTPDEDEEIKQGENYTDPNADISYASPNHAQSEEQRQDALNCKRPREYTCGLSRLEMEQSCEAQGDSRAYFYGGNHVNEHQPNIEENKPLSIGAWVLVLLVGMVPCVSTVVYLVWAFETGGNINRKNFCKANLILQLASLLLVIFFMFIVSVGVVSTVFYY